MGKSLNKHMEALNTALQGINNNITALTTLVTGVTALIALIVKNIHSNKKLSGKFDTHASYRDKQLEQLITELTSIKKSIEPLIEYQNKKAYLAELRAVIELSGNTALQNCKNDAFYQICIDGMDAAFEYFARIYKDGFETVEQKKLQFRALNHLSKIRSAHLVNEGVTLEKADKIKVIANNCLGDLIRKLMQLKTGFYNGHSELEYKEIVGKFIYDFINESYKVF